mmetsp:Transcript_4038/g.9627  ORF Transcript_4038/g.9627 Transcript_4038/m.9627 type:complete len:220 (+) Transcript_4038:1234-1893(+)
MVVDGDASKSPAIAFRSSSSSSPYTCRSELPSLDPSSSRRRKFTHSLIFSETSSDGSARSQVLSTVYVLATRIVFREALPVASNAKTDSTQYNRVIPSISRTVSGPSSQRSGSIPFLSSKLSSSGPMSGIKSGVRTLQTLSNHQAFSFVSRQQFRTIPAIPLRRKGLEFWNFSRRTGRSLWRTDSWGVASAVLARGVRVANFLPALTWVAFMSKAAKCW